MAGNKKKATSVVWLPVLLRQLSYGKTGLRISVPLDLDIED